MTQYIYQTDFYLMAEVNDYEDAKAYLEEENMLYFFYDSTFDSKLDSIYWKLDNEYSGRVIVTANQELNDLELKKLSDFILAQNADGLGEGFEQQDFANYDAALIDDYGNENSELAWADDYEEDWVMASFDWKHNEYPLTLVSVD